LIKVEELFQRPVTHCQRAVVGGRIVQQKSRHFSLVSLPNHMLIILRSGGLVVQKVVQAKLSFVVEVPQAAALSLTLDHRHSRVRRDETVAGTA
jgi:hypothetical protein